MITGDRMGKFAEKFDVSRLKGRHLIAGLSGGADSMSLVHFLVSHQEQGGWTMEAVHLNHCLRGEESDRDEAAVRRFCEELGVLLQAKRADIARLAKETGQSEEACGREVRYRLFAKAAGEARQLGKDPVVVTAHTLSDDLETVLLHLVRGCALDGLCGIPQERMLEGNIPLVRPMLAISREEVEVYCAENALLFVTDSTNLSEAYARNRLRLQVLPNMKALNPSLEETYLRMRESLSADRDYLAQQTGALLKVAETADGWCAEVLMSAHEALRSRAEGEILRQSDVPVSTLHIRQLDEVIMGKAKALTLGSVRFQLRGGILMAERDSTFEAAAVSLPVSGAGKTAVTVTERDKAGEIISQWQRPLIFRTISAEEYALKRKVYKKLLYFAVDYDTIMVDAVIRTRAPGDFIRLPGDGGRKTLKKQLQEMHLSRKERETRLLLAQGSEVIWLEGLGVGKAFLPGSGTRRVLIAAKEDPKHFLQ